ELQSSELPDTLVFEPVIADANDSISTVLETDLEPLFDEDFESDADLALEFSGVESTPQEPVEFESDTAKTNETEEILTVLETVPEPSADEVFSVSCLDEEMVEIFLEEAMDLLESAGES